MVNMRSFTELELRNQSYLVDKGVEFTQVQITQVGINKSILDATTPMRLFFKEHDIHDYETQLFSPEFKVLIPTHILSVSKDECSQTSMYRANHRGDPRLWFGSKVKEQTSPDDIFLIFALESQLYIINHTRIDIAACCESSLESPIKELIGRLTRGSSFVADELLMLLRKHHGEWIASDICADTAIGRKVETLLGIPMNASKQPDYKGIELKSFRDQRPGVRKTLFCRVPDWDISRVKSAQQLCSLYGYPPEANFKSYRNTLVFQKPNSQSLCLNITNSNELLAIEEGIKANEAYHKNRDVAVWRMLALHEALLTKHNETFWIEVHSELNSGREYFQLKQVEYTRHPIVSQFDTLIERGMISVDLLLGRGIDPQTGKRIKKSGGDSVSFKIDKRATGLLFPESRFFDI